MPPLIGIITSIFSFTHCVVYYFKSYINSFIMADKIVKKEEKPKMEGQQLRKQKLLQAKKASRAASKGIYLTRQAHHPKV